jgi:hypothetical protein
MTNTSDQLIERSNEPRVGPGALEDAALILLSPVLFPLEVFVGILPVLALTWVAGTIMLWSSRGWTAGQKLIGMILSAASFIAISVAHVETSEPLGMVAAIAILLVLTLLMATPAIVGVIYLLRTRRPGGRLPRVRSEPPPAGGPLHRP